jgi:DNA mismatch repair ATPase MutL
MTSDAAVSETIKNALEDALEAETAPQTAPPPKESPVETNAETQPEAVESPVRATVPESNDVTSAQAPAQEANAQSSAQETNTAELVPQKLDKSRWDGLSGTTYVNVMQILVEENTEKYMKMFGLCQCPRCVVDVKALALNNLPPKYVVMKEGEMVPRITLYEGRFQTAVTAQVLRACQSVMANPRHDRTT